MSSPVSNKRQKGIPSGKPIQKDKGQVSDSSSRSIPLTLQQKIEELQVQIDAKQDAYNQLEQIRGPSRKLLEREKQKTINMLKNELSELRDELKIFLPKPQSRLHGLMPSAHSQLLPKDLSEQIDEKSMRNLGLAHELVDRMTGPLEKYLLNADKGQSIDYQTVKFLRKEYTDSFQEIQNEFLNKYGIRDDLAELDVQIQELTLQKNELEKQDAKEYQMAEKEQKFRPSPPISSISVAPVNKNLLKEIEKLRLKIEEKSSYLDGLNDQYTAFVNEGEKLIAKAKREQETRDFWIMAKAAKEGYKGFDHLLARINSVLISESEIGLLFNSWRAKGALEKISGLPERITKQLQNSEAEFQQKRSVISEETFKLNMQIKNLKQALKVANENYNYAETLKGTNVKELLIRAERRVILGLDYLNAGQVYTHK